MELSNIVSASIPLDIPYGSPISSKDLNAFSETVSADMNNIVKLVNVLVRLINGLKIDGFDANALDYNLLPKMSSEHIKLFTSTSPSSPIKDLFGDITLFEALGVVLQILANIDNGLKHGIKKTNESFTANVPKTYTWNFKKDAFVYRAFKQDTDGSYIDVTNLFTVKIDSSSTSVIVTSSETIAEINFFIWQPNFMF